VRKPSYSHIWTMLNMSTVFYYFQFLPDRTATQYDRLLASSCCPSVCPSVRLWRCALWLSGLVYGAKSYTSVLLASVFLFVPFDTCCRMYRLATKRDHKKTREREREFCTTTCIAINLLTRLMVTCWPNSVVVSHHAWVFLASAL